MSLEIELAWFECQRKEWLLAHEGEFALVHGQCVGFFKEWTEAFKSGVDTYGIKEPFLVKPVLEEDEVFLIFLS